MPGKVKDQVQLQSDFSEIQTYNYDGLRYFFKKGTICSETGYDVLCHWHPELEFLYLLSGQRDYFVNGDIFHLTAGEGLFINSRRMHNGFSNDHQDCTFLVMDINAELFLGNSQSLHQKAESYFGPGNVDYIRFSTPVPWQNEILRHIYRGWQLQEGHPGNPMLPLSEAIAACGILWENLTPVESSRNEMKDMNSILKMTDFIRNHYQEKITIEEIAKSGIVCRSKGCRLFRQYLNQTPNNYLNSYRLNKSLELLRETELDITEVALACGFQSTSYFINFFRKIKKMTPGEYRASNIET